MKPNIKEITRKGKAFYLAYDQGLEHGPADFNDKNIDPEYIFDIAEKGEFTGFIVQKGIAEKYQKKISNMKTPLILKLNGKTNLVKGEPISRQLCSVEEAIELGAKAVGYTIYLGSEHESEMMQEFQKVQEKARKKGLPIIVWMYIRGKSIEESDKSKGELMAYAARIGLEIGADIIKIKYNDKKKDLKWAVDAAGKTNVVVAGGTNKARNKFLIQVKEIIDAGCIGLAVGRNIWQDDKPLEVANKTSDIIWGEK